uniref:Ciliated bronchial epithelium 1 n=1 Tax=Molossus molossus TaxID=27622 RepID=A0A7J8EC97_MOLMO|nr:ciliated bronchial epithelium 1 [Molossus molossus]
MVNGLPEGPGLIGAPHYLRRSVSPYEHRPGMHCAVINPPLSYYPCPNLRWDTSHFKKTGGPQRNNYVVHPEFVSETYPDYCCW